MNYAVIENQLVINTVESDSDYAESQSWILLENGFGIGDFYIDGEFVKAPQPQPTPEEIQAQNKATATSLLSATDWTCTVDIANPQYSNPYLMNQDAFLSYRSQVRAIAVNPPITPVTFPTAPTEVWSN
jgi:hypothetical protein